MSSVWPVLVVPVAVNVTGLPPTILLLAGVTLIETRLARVTVTVVDPLTVPEVAVMVALPVLTAVMRPPELIFAMVASELVQKTFEVRVLVVPSSKVPVAAICKVLPCWTDGVGGPTVIVVNVGLTKKPRQPADIRLKTSAKLSSTNLGLELNMA